MLNSAALVATGTLSPVPPFDFQHTLAFLNGFTPMSEEQSLAPQALTKAVYAAGKPVVFRLVSRGTVDRPLLEYTLYSREPLDAAATDAVLDRIRFFLSLDDDLTAFYSAARQDAPFERVVQQLYGFHHVKFMTPFEIACWSVLVQRNPMPLAKRMKMSLVRDYVEPLCVDGADYYAFPEPDAILTNDIGKLDAIVGSKRAAYLYGIAEQFLIVDEAFLRTGDYETVKAWLLGLKGIGAWSAAFIMLRGLGRMERVPLDEMNIQTAAARLYRLADTMTPGTLLSLAERYGAMQGYWAYYLRNARL